MTDTGLPAESLALAHRLRQLRRIRRTYWWLCAVLVAMACVGLAAAIADIVVIIFGGARPQPGVLGFLVIRLLPVWVACAVNLYLVAHLRHPGRAALGLSVAVFVLDVLLAVWFAFLAPDYVNTYAVSLLESIVGWGGFAVFCARGLFDLYAVPVLFRNVKPDADDPEITGPRLAERLSGSDTDESGPGS